jgi:putative lipoic acid-binding regulatory protein
VASDPDYLQQLRAAHEFPCEYTFKLIGDNSDTLIQTAMAHLLAVLPRSIPNVTTRESSKGNHQSVTIVVEVPDAETVEALYLRFRTVTGVKVLL